MALRGSPELRRRLKAIRGVFKTSGRDWGNEVVKRAKPRIPVASGKTRGSVRVRNASQRKATVVGFYPVNFIDAGTKAHDVTAKKANVLKFSAGGQTVFRKKVHKRATRARPFKRQVAEEALREHSILADLIELWNRAA